MDGYQRVNLIITGLSWCDLDKGLLSHTRLSTCSHRLCGWVSSVSAPGGATAIRVWRGHPQATPGGGMLSPQPRVGDTEVTPL